VDDFGAPVVSGLSLLGDGAHYVFREAPHPSWMKMHFCYSIFQPLRARM